MWQLNFVRHWTDIKHQEAHLSMNHAAEVIGKVQSDLTIRVLSCSDFGTDFGMFTQTHCAFQDERCCPATSFLPWVHQLTPRLMISKITLSWTLLSTRLIDIERSFTLRISCSKRAVQSGKTTYLRFGFHAKYRAERVIDGGASITAER